MHLHTSKIKKIYWILVIALIASSTSFAIQPPYLISVTAQSDSTIELSWRNNAVETTGFQIFRKAPGETALTLLIPVVIDSTKYIDTGLVQLSIYTYAIKAFSATDTSEFSNVDSATTLELNGFMGKPIVYEIYYFRSTNLFQIKYFDSSNCEIGIKIYYAENDTNAPFQLFDEIKIVTPKDVGYPTYTGDITEIKPNTKYYFYISMYNSVDTAVSEIKSWYSFDANEIRESLTEIYLVEKLSEFPIAYKSWSMYLGDTLLLNETNAPESSVSVIDFSDKKNPLFAGYIKVDTIIVALKEIANIDPHHFHSRYYAYKRNLIIVADSSLYMFKYINGNFLLTDSLKYTEIYEYYHRCFLTRGAVLNDSTIICYTLYTYSAYQPWAIYKLWTITISNDTFILSQKIDETINSYNRKSYNVQIIRGKEYFVSWWKGWQRFDIVDFSDSINNPYVCDITLTQNNTLYTHEFWLMMSHNIIIEDSLVIKDSTLTNYNHTYFDTTDTTITFVFDSLISIYKYSFIPIGIISDFSSNPANQIVPIHINQAGSRVTISFSQSSPVNELLIYSLNGRLIRRIDTADRTRFSFKLPAGVSILRAKTKNGVVQKKFCVLK